MLDVLPFLVGIGAILGLSIALFYAVKKTGRTEERERTQAEILKDIEEANIKANRDAEEIANMSRDDKRDELSK